MENSFIAASCAVSPVIDPSDDAGVLDAIANLVNNERWEGGEACVGLRHDLHLASFYFDAAARTAASVPALITERVSASATRVLRRLAGDDRTKAGLLLQGLQMFEAETNLVIVDKWKAAEFIAAEALAAAPPPVECGRPRRRGWRPTSLIVLVLKYLLSFTGSRSARRLLHCGLLSRPFRAAR